MIVCVLFFFFKQKTAYEMHISDWSSDVCSSDLRPARREAARPGRPAPRATAGDDRATGGGAARPPADRGGPSRPAFQRKKRGRKWRDARSWLVLNIGRKTTGTLPAPPQGFYLAERRKAQPVGCAAERKIGREEPTSVGKGKSVAGR